MKETQSLYKLKRIYEDYITINSPMELNLDYETKANISKKVESGEDLDLSLYDAAYDELLSVIRTDLFPGFLKSILDTSL